MWWEDACFKIFPQSPFFKQYWNANWRKMKSRNNKKKQGSQTWKLSCWKAPTNECSRTLKVGKTTPHKINNLEQRENSMKTPHTNECSCTWECRRRETFKGVKRWHERQFKVWGGDMKDNLKYETVIRKTIQNEEN